MYKKYVYLLKIKTKINWIIQNLNANILLVIVFLDDRVRNVINGIKFEEFNILNLICVLSRLLFIILVLFFFTYHYLARVENDYQILVTYNLLLIQ